MNLKQQHNIIYGFLFKFFLRGIDMMFEAKILILKGKLYCNCLINLNGRFFSWFWFWFILRELIWCLKQNSYWRWKMTLIVLY